MMKINNKITIIEGPTPEFEPVNQVEGFNIPHPWALGILDGPIYYNTASTALRTLNSDLLIERCETAWAAQVPMYLIYRDQLGLEQQTQIIAARALKSEAGDLILLWVRNGIDEDKSNVSPIRPDHE